MTTIDDIISFIAKNQLIDSTRIKPTSDLCRDLGIYGDDFFELIEEYEKIFEVDMSRYLWYFHHQEEVSAGIGGLFFKPPYERVNHIPVTPLVLLEAANRKSWHIEYPEHTLPPERYDMLINRYIALFFLILIVVIAIFKICLTMGSSGSHR